MYYPFNTRLRNKKNKPTTRKIGVKRLWVIQFEKEDFYRYTLPKYLTL